MEGTIRRPDDPGFRLIETLGWHPGEGLRRGDRHLARMARSAAALGIGFDRDAALRALDLAGDKPLRCRLTLDAGGAFELTTAPLGPAPARWRVALAGARLDPGDPWLRHKTTRRRLYDAARASLPAGIDEMLFLNTAGALCEGTITNVFLDTGSGALLTPDLSAGLLPGILRQELLERGRAAEARLTHSDLHAARRIWVGNSLRGLIPADPVPA